VSLLFMISSVGRDVMNALDALGKDSGNLAYCLYVIKN